MRPSHLWSTERASISSITRRTRGPGVAVCVSRSYRQSRGATRSVRDGVDERAGERWRLGCVSGVGGAAASVGASCALSHAPTATARTMTATTMARSDFERVVVGSEASPCPGGGGGLDGRGGAADGATLAVLAASRLRSSGWLLTSAPAPSGGGFPSSYRGAAQSGHVDRVRLALPVASETRAVGGHDVRRDRGGVTGGLLGRGGGRRGGGCRSGGRGRRSARGGARARTLVRACGGGGR